MMNNPFKNYKEALEYLIRENQKLMILANYEPDSFEWAMWTLIKSKKFREWSKIIINR